MIKLRLSNRKTSRNLYDLNVYFKDKDTSTSFPIYPEEEQLRLLATG